MRKKPPPRQARDQKGPGVGTSPQCRRDRVTELTRSGQVRRVALRPGPQRRNWQRDNPGMFANVVLVDGCELSNPLRKGWFTAVDRHRQAMVVTDKAAPGGISAD